MHKALNIFPDFHDGVFLLAQLYERENKQGDAKKYVGDYLKSNPSDTSAVRLFKSLSDSTQVK